MNKFKISRLTRSNIFSAKSGLLIALAAPTLALLVMATPAWAHHAMGGKMPSNFFEGFMSGIAHPLIGLDHLAFVVAVGLLAVNRKRGVVIPIAFMLAAMVGTGTHLANVTIPGVELLVSGSILLFGILLARKDSLDTTLVAGLSTMAGLFHGYAYGEAIFGAETTPLLAYLGGFTVVQLAVSLAAFWVGGAAVGSKGNEHSLIPNKLSSAGLVISGVGLAFFVSQLVGMVFPAP